VDLGQDTGVAAPPRISHAGRSPSTALSMIPILGTPLFGRVAGIFASSTGAALCHRRADCSDPRGLLNGSSGPSSILLVDSALFQLARASRNTGFAETAECWTQR
jgi:hypothetical protein